MKKIVFFTLAAILALSLCACNMSADEPTTATDPVTDPPATSSTEPTSPMITEPIIDPTMDTNIPDPSVDDGHLMDPSEGDSAAPGMNP